jgi:hypothetical protein
MDDDLMTWLRAAVNARLGTARYLIESEAASAEWHEPCSGVLVTGAPTHDDTWDGTHAIGDSRLTRFIAMNDPQDTIARCEAELAILDEHATEIYRDESGIVGYHAYWCQTCHIPRDQPGRDWCRTVRLLAAGYRHWPGYRDEWAL